jgi:Ferritin-like domain
MTIDERGLAELTSRSRDVHTDAMRATREPLAEIVEVGHEQRAHSEIDPEAGRVFATQRNARLGKGLGLLGGVGIGAALLGLFEQPAFADKASDIQMLQTSASIEVLAIAAYTAVLGLPFAGSLPAVVQTFVTTTKGQHTDHLQAFNAAAKALGGKEQTMADPVLAQVVEQAKPGLTGPGPVLDLAIELENTAAETYVANTGALEDESAKKVTASIMGVEAQHVSVLLAVQALLNGGLVDQIALPPPDLNALPAAAGGVGFPNAFYKTDMARAADEGAVK